MEEERKSEKARPNYESWTVPDLVIEVDRLRSIIRKNKSNFLALQDLCRQQATRLGMGGKTVGVQVKPLIHSAEWHLAEKLAAHMHDRVWTGWVEYMLRKLDVVIMDRPYKRCPEDDEFDAHTLLERWRRQMATPYVDLTEEEKESNRDIAKEILALLENK